MKYKKIIQRDWKSLNKRQKKQLKTILRDITDELINEYAETIRIPKIHTSKQYIAIPIDDTEKEFRIMIEVNNIYSF